MKSEPSKEHDWLHRLVGEWTVVTDATPDAGGCPSQSGHPAWTEKVRSLRGLWVVAEGEGAMPDGNPATSMMTLGYDPQKQRYIGTWVGSMMTHMWVYSGTLDESGETLTLDTEGPDFVTDGKIVRYQDIIGFPDADHRTLTSRVLGDDGAWKTFMTMRYRRTA